MKNECWKPWVMGVLMSSVIAVVSGCAIFDGEPIDQRAAAAYHQGDWSKAIQLYTAAIEQKGDQYEFYLNRGRAYKSVGRSSAALEDLNQAKQIHPKDPERRVVRARASILYKEGKYNDALKDVKVILKGAPDATHYMVLKGKCLYKVKHFKEALETFKSAYETLPTTSEQGREVGRSMAWTLFKQKEYAKALQTYMKRYFYPKKQSDDTSLSPRDYFAAGQLYHVNVNDEKKKQMWDQISSERLKELKQNAKLGIK